MKLLRIVLIVLLLGGPALGQAEQESKPKPKRPRVGLVLAGGSARGLAHVGVLKWLAEHRIPLDYVAGTSMGGLVGGLYASGLTPEEMEAFIGTIDWEAALQMAAPLNDQSLRRKEDLREFPTNLEFGMRHGFQAPSGLSPGHGVELMISRFAAPYSGMSSFDDLPTAFRCVAVDLTDRKRVVFQDGDLSDALRATMSIPGLFAPARKNGMVLVDGGILNNLPVEVVKEMGAEVIIAVTLVPPAQDPSNLSLLGVAGASVDVTIYTNELTSLKLADLAIVPEMAGVESEDFHRYEELGRRGYQAAGQKARFLETLTVDQPEWDAYLAERARRRRNISRPVPQFVEVVGAGEQEKRIAARLQRFVGTPLVQQDVEEELTEITGRGRYESAHFTEVVRDGRTGLRVTLHEKTYAPPILKVILNIDGSEVADVRFGVAARLTYVDVGGPGSEWRTDFGLGNPNRVATEYYWRIAGGPLFIAPRGFADYSRQDFYSGDQRLAQLGLSNVGAGADIGVLMGKSAEFRTGYELNWARQYVTTGSPVLPEVKGVFQSYRARVLFEGLDDPLIPRKGFSGVATMRWVFDGPQVTQAFPVVESRLLLAVPLQQRTRLLVAMSGGTTAGRSAPLDPFTLGGPFRLSSLPPDQQRGNNYYYSSFNVLRSLGNRPINLLGRTYFGAGYELGRAFNSLSVAEPYHAGTFGFIGVTPLGGIFLGASVGTNGDHKVFFRIGRLFF